MNELPAKRLSYHTDYSNWVPTGPNQTNPFRNPRTNRGPIEGRPPGEVFSHQRWSEFFPKKAYIMTLGRVQPNTRFHPALAEQRENSIWSNGAGRFPNGTRSGEATPPLFKLRCNSSVKS